jgi:thiopeptide-type bacteriocin biosynthesis protein
MQQQWLSYHFYPLESENVFLNRAVRPFLAQHIWPTPGARAFFVRYDDAKGPHIRLRLRGAADWLADTLAPALAEHFEGRGERQAMPYEPEIARFGGPEAMAWAEEHFHLSTRVALDRLAQPGHSYGDAMFDALRMHSVTAFAAGLDQPTAARYFDALCTQWMGAFLPGTDAAGQAALRADFEQKLAPQRQALLAALTDTWAALAQDKLDKTQAEWLRWLRGNQLILKELDKNLERALPNLLHLSNNRLGLQNPDELYLNHILAQV